MVYNLSEGDGVKHTILKWGEHAWGGALTNAQYLASKKEKDRISERASDRSAERHRTDESKNKGLVYGVATKSAPDTQGNKPREVRFEDWGRERAEDVRLDWQQPRQVSPATVMMQTSI